MRLGNKPGFSEWALNVLKTVFLRDGEGGGVVRVREGDMRMEIDLRERRKC